MSNLNIHKPENTYSTRNTSSYQMVHLVSFVLEDLMKHTEKIPIDRSNIVWLIKLL